MSPKLTINRVRHIDIRPAWADTIVVSLYCLPLYKENENKTLSAFALKLCFINKRTTWPITLLIFFCLHFFFLPHPKQKGFPLRSNCLSNENTPPESYCVISKNCPTMPKMFGISLYCQRSKKGRENKSFWCRLSNPIFYISLSEWHFSLWLKMTQNSCFLMVEESIILSTAWLKSKRKVWLSKISKRITVQKKIIW